MPSLSDLSQSFQSATVEGSQGLRIWDRLSVASIEVEIGSLGVGFAWEVERGGDDGK